MKNGDELKNNDALKMKKCNNEKSREYEGIVNDDKKNWIC